MAQLGPRAHVLATRPRGSTLTLAQSRKQLSGETQAGQTAHFIVYTDNTSNGNASAQNVLATCEADWAAVQNWFGGINLPPGQDGDDQTTPRTAMPIYVVMDPNAGGAYHYSCSATDIYIEPTPEMASGLMVAELVEVFEAAINNGWSCGQTNGEGLSRVLAVERNSALAAVTISTYNDWWNNGHGDYVNDNSATDQDSASNGCATLFLYYLHSQLNFTWQQIVAAGAPTLGGTYQKLTGQNPQQGFQDFLGRLATLDNGSGLTVPGSGNPFPIGATSTPRDTGSSLPNLGGNGGVIAVGLIIVAVVVLIVLVASGTIHIG
jgi:hypothetical protein